MGHAVIAELSRRTERHLENVARPETGRLPHRAIPIFGRRVCDGIPVDTANRRAHRNLKGSRGMDALAIFYLVEQCEQEVMNVSPKEISPVVELRVAITTQDFDRLASFYRQGLGLEPSQVWPEDQGRALVLDLGRATLEVFDVRQAATVDELEVGRHISGPVRFALQVPDLDAAVARLTAHGADLMSGPVDTPWGDRNARFQDPDGMQITLYEVPGAEVSGD